MIAIVNGKILTMAGTEHERGTVIINEGKIEKIGEDITIPSGAKVVDAEGKFVMPGLIDAHCHVGIAEEIYSEGDDTNECTDPITPSLRAIDAINPEDLGFEDARKGGVTTVAVAPGSANVIGGQIAVLKTKGNVVDEMLIEETAALKAALGENPKRVYGDKKKKPQTRMAEAAILREIFVKSESYARDEDYERDLGLEIVHKVERGSLPLHIHAHRADDIATAIRIAKEFDATLVLIHATEGHKIGKFISEAEVPVIAGPLFSSRAKVEMKNLCWESPGLMAKAGVELALCTDHPVIPINYLLLCAAFAHRAGLSRQVALASITSTPAKILEIEDRVGSLEPGKDADIIILSGDPLSADTEVEKVFIDGKLVK